MFKYTIRAVTNRRKRPVVVAVTNFRDVATYIRDNAAAALDPAGVQGMEIYMVENQDADLFVPLNGGADEV